MVSERIPYCMKSKTERKIEILIKQEDMSAVTSVACFIDAHIISVL